MAVFHTSHGGISVSNWGYQLQGLGGAALDPAALAALNFDLLVTDFSRDGSNAQALTAAEFDAIKTHAVAVSYISIGEASDFRSFWNPAWTTTGLATGALTASAPDWLGPDNPAFPESRKVRYWEAGWQDLIFNTTKTGWLDKIVAQGFDAAYLDIVDAYFFWAAEATAAQKHPGDPLNETGAANRMIDFIVALTAHTRETNPNFFVIPQNGAFIVDALANADPARKAAFLGSIGAIAVEDVFLRHGTAPENNGFAPDAATLAVLQHDFLDNGKAVLSVDYVNTLNPMGDFLNSAINHGFIPTVAPTRGLDRTLAPLHAIDSTGEGPDLVAGTAAADVIQGKGGNDTLFGFGGTDQLYGGDGNDQLSGGLNKDRLDGGAGNDLLDGGFGRDVLIGGLGSDRFDFNTLADSAAAATRRDVIVDFQHGQDRIGVSTIDANLTTAGNGKFVWQGLAAFTGHAGELHAVRINQPGTLHDRTIVEGDVNGDGVADIQIVLIGLVQLTAKDFIL